MMDSFKKLETDIQSIKTLVDCFESKSKTEEELINVK